MDHYLLTPAATSEGMERLDTQAYDIPRDDAPYWKSMELAAKRGLTFREALRCLAVQNRVRSLRSMTETRTVESSDRDQARRH